MDLSWIIQTAKEYVPIPVIIAVICVIMLVYSSSWIASAIEESIEQKKGKQIKIFDHKKIWLSAFWCIIVTVALAVSKTIEWKQVLYYWLIILGASTFLYEAFLKKIGMNKEDKQ